MNISPTVDLLTTEPLEQQVVPMSLCANAGQPDDVPVAVGHTDDDENEEDDADEDTDDLDDDEDEEEDDEDLDYDWEEVGDEDEDEEEEEEEDDEEDDDEVEEEDEVEEDAQSLDGLNAVHCLMGQVTSRPHQATGENWGTWLALAKKR